MSTTMTQRLGLWLQGVIGGFIGGGASAITAGIVVPAMDKGGDFQMLTWQWFEMVGAMFFTAGVIGAMLYLKQHPVPEIVEADNQKETK